MTIQTLELINPKEITPESPALKPATQKEADTGTPKATAVAIGKTTFEALAMRVSPTEANQEGVTIPITMPGARMDTDE